MTRSAPIGVFDSGFGGLSVLRAIRAALPSEDLIYCADHAWLPWGEREVGCVRERARILTGALVGAGAKAVVVACNTATAAAAEGLRREFDLPVVAMEPAVKPAAAATRNGIVGVLGTGGTLASARFSALLDRYGAGMEVITRPAPELVEAVETDDPEQRRARIADAVGPLIDRGADVIVLGCTHFPFLRAEIEALVGPGIAVIDTGAAVARELARRLETGALDSPPDHAGRERFWTTGDPAALTPALHRLWGGGRLESMPLKAAEASRTRAQAGFGFSETP
ncbi:MAG: glutamate racemase [Halofilum sp. (in: g-proteobacteria)]|nr:glutamate racemase [Halofilum sp. (in: g-proteobacteria)]